ncbi:diguanylate cyclase domain-containing protein [Deinococcus maricopensis]|uniref:Diguanylate cyclase with PAS/PAC sensor n=1 Tax=Deinococcus maricopensis (strain DSM 21211 / LMG 22137 / NRRL B-23946 / LB-34) TaxID=709986 RepID=E8U8J8_DEIML|nr:diguanylate cyclase [Deinococcus maricopensis]ADV67387.1 diguanylate cyclase with PAS/PAC sensor [Deinococcus maricopensis DSM 21211]
MSGSVQHHLKTFRLITALSLALIALLSVTSLLTLAHRAQTHGRDARLIDVSGRERMLSQRIALTTLELTRASTPTARDLLRAQLDTDIARMADAHARLTDAHSDLYPNGTRDADLNAVYNAESTLSAKVTAFLQAARTVARTTGPVRDDTDEVRTILAARDGPLLPALDAAVTVHALRIEAKFRQFTTLASTLLGLTLVLLALIGFGVLTPLMRRYARAAAALTQERNFARQVMASMGQGLALAGPDGRYRYVNPAFADLLGCAPEALLGQRPSAILMEHADVPHEGRLEVTLRGPGGHPIPVLLTSVPHDWPDGTGHIMVITDLTERHAAESAIRTRERLYRTLAANFPDGALLLFGHDLRHTIVDGQGLGAVGLRKENLEGRTLQEALPPAIAALLDGPYRAALRGEECQQDITALERTFVMHTVPVRDEHGSVLAGMAIVQDVTERRAAEAARERTAAYTAALLDVTRLSETDLAPEDVAAQALQIVACSADVDWAGVIMFEGDYAHTTTAWSAPTVSEPFRDMATQGLMRGQGRIWDVMDAGTPLFMDDYLSAPGTYPPFITEGVRSAAWVPLTTMGAQRFMFTAARMHHPRPWDTQDQALFNAVARTVQLSLERRAHVNALRDAALTDVLTGLRNRRAFEQDLEVELDRAARHKYSVGVLLVDLDGLKVLNDAEGHERGDALLVTFARQLRQQLRLEDGVYRLGGDEYAAILVHADEYGQPSLERRLRAAVNGTRAAGFPGMDASAGLAFAPREERHMSALLRRADERMYAQKEQHRAQRRAARSEPAS